MMKPSARSNPRFAGFTLAELLIALAILGVIATFTIPKILGTQQGSEANAIAKEVAGMISGAYSSYRAEHGATAATKATDLTPYMNYVSMQTTGTFDETPGVVGTLACSAGAPCLILANGALLRVASAGSFGGTSATNCLPFWVDHDGQLTSGSSDYGKTIDFFLCYTGRITTYGEIEPNTTTSTGTYNPAPSRDPDWFSWSN